MKNTRKAIAFIVSLYVFIFFFMILNTFIPTESLLESPNSALAKAALYITGYIIALYSQALIKYIFVKKQMKSLNISMSFPGASFELRDRLFILLLPLLAVIIPMISQRAVSADSLRSLLYVAVLALIIEVLYLLNKRTVKIHIGDKGIAVSGIDFRIEFSIPLNYKNAVGFYPYDRIDNYLALNDEIIIYHTYDFGPIAIKCTPEEVRQIRGLLVSKRIPEKRY